MKSVNFTWYTDDVLAVAPHLTEEQAYEVLLEIRQNHDAEVGVNWDVIRETAYNFFPVPIWLVSLKSESHDLQFKFDNKPTIELLQKVVWQFTKFVNECEGHDVDYQDVSAEVILLSESLMEHGEGISHGLCEESVTGKLFKGGE